MRNVRYNILTPYSQICEKDSDIINGFEFPIPSFYLLTNRNRKIK